MSLRTSRSFLLHPAPPAEAGVATVSHRVWPTAPGGVATGTSGALKGAFPGAKGPGGDEKPPRTLPAATAVARPSSCLSSPRAGFLL